MKKLTGAPIKMDTSSILKKPFERRRAILKHDFYVELNITCCLYLLDIMDSKHVTGELRLR
jgi:hypothetical protein